MNCLFSCFKNPLNSEIDEQIATFEEVEKCLPSDLTRIVLSYKGPNREELGVSDIALKILDEADWDCSRLSKRNQRYLRCIPRTEVAQLHLPWASIDKRIGISNQLFKFQALVIGGDCEISAVSPNSLCDSIIKLPYLRKLHINNCPLSDRHIVEIIESCPMLEDLKLTKGEQITDLTLGKLASLRHLKKVHITGDSTKFTGQGLSNCRQLTTLFLGRAFSWKNPILNELPLEKIIEDSPFLEAIHIDGFRLTVKKLRLLGGMPCLKKIFVGDYDRDKELERGVEALGNEFPQKEWLYNGYFVYGDID